MSHDQKAAKASRARRTNTPDVEAPRQSDARYREIIEALGVAVYTTDAAGRITSFNEAAATLWGRRPELGKDLWCGSWRLYWPDGTPMRHDECPMALTLKEGRPVRGVEVVAERPDGTRVPLLPHPSPLRDGSGALIGAVNVLVDLTERKRAEADLQESEARMAAVLKEAVDGIITIDAGGVIQSINAAAARIFGYDEDEMVGKNVTMLMPDEYTRQHLDSLRRYLETGEARVIGIGREVEGRRKDGTIFPVDISVSEVVLGDTRLFTGIVRDLTERKRAEAAERNYQQRLDLTMQAAKMGAWEWNIASGEVTWSQTLEEIHGLAPGTFGGTFEGYLKDIHPEDRERVVETVGHSVEAGKHEIEYRIIWPDGDVRWLSAHGLVIHDPAGRPERMIGLCMDVTARKRAEQAEQFLAEVTSLLAASYMDYEMTLASLARLAVPHLGEWCSISVIRDDGSVRHLGLAHQDPAQVAQAQVVARQYPFDPDEPYGLARVLRTGEAEFYPIISDNLLETLVQDKSLLEAVRRFGLKSVICVPLVARGRTLGAITLATAESGRHYTAADLALAEELARRAGIALDNARLYAQATRASEAKDEFLGLVSHELRTPITALYGGARMLRSRGDKLTEEDRQRLLTDVELESERLYRMVEDLLALARVELGQTVPAEPVLAQRVLDKVTYAFSQRRPGRPIGVEIEGELEPVAAQQTYVEQVLRNLLSNADKYSPDGSPIVVHARQVNGTVEITVLDRGPGIAEGEAEMIFERFYRSDKTPGRAKGVGLGLTVCKRLIEAQSGRVWARPNNGGGLEVGFALPVYGEEER